MPDRIKERLDLDWHTLLDELNQTYEEAYQRVMATAPRLGKLEGVRLVLVQWREGEQLDVGLMAMVQREKGDHE